MIYYSEVICYLPEVSEFWPQNREALIKVTITKGKQLLLSQSQVLFMQLPTPPPWWLARSIYLFVCLFVLCMSMYFDTFRVVRRQLIKVSFLLQAWGLNRGLYIWWQAPVCNKHSLSLSLSLSLCLSLFVYLSQGFYSCTNIMTKKQVGEERVYLTYTSILLFITKGSQDWNSSRSGSRSWCRGHGGMFFIGLLLLAYSACSLIEPKTTAQRWYHPQGALLPWSLIETIPYSWISWRHSPN